ncbi:MAG: hypothetical protein IID44_28240 [Planctomycetes bacterium]|nr:hypothetical protein [Planctomycetota bacterium]
MSCRYLAAARYDDMLRVRTTTTQMGRATVQHAYQVFRGEELIVEGASTVACVDDQGKVRRLPDWLRAGSAVERRWNGAVTLAPSHLRHKRYTRIFGTCRANGRGKTRRPAPSIQKVSKTSGALSEPSDCAPPSTKSPAASFCFAGQSKH